MALVAVITGASSGIGEATARPLATEGFPARELLDKATTRWMVSDTVSAAEAILDAGLRGHAERYVPRPYGLAAAAGVLAPGVLRRLQATGAGSVMTTRTGADDEA